MCWKCIIQLFPPALMSKSLLHNFIGKDYITLVGFCVSERCTIRQLDFRKWLAICLIISDIEHLFKCLQANCMTSLKRCLFRSSMYFFIGFIFFLMSYMSCLYILELNPLLVASFANIFSHSMGCLSVLLMVSFTMQEILSLIWSLLLIFLFSFISEVDPKRYYGNLCQKVFCLCFPLIVLQCPVLHLGL